MPDDATGLRNRNGDEVARGNDSFVGLRSPNGGDDAEDVPASELFYCGQRRGLCWCGNCDGVCGPNSGCPCDACLALVGIAINRLGRIARRSHASGASTSDILYCGGPTSDDRCGKCRDGVCGPTSGCPCLPCLELAASDLFSRRSFRRPDGKLTTLPLMSRGAAAISRSTNLPTSQTFQCGAVLKNGNDTCRATESVCFKCHSLSFSVRASANLMLNDEGHVATLGSGPFSPQGFEISSGNTYYCGRNLGQCRCGNCDGRCGPTNGCPCDSCLRLTQAVIRGDSSIDQQLRNDAMFLVRPAKVPAATVRRILSGMGREVSDDDDDDDDSEEDDISLIYCGRIILGRKCVCGNDCGPRCGPTDGCPCYDCIEMLLGNIGTDTNLVTAAMSTEMLLENMIEQAAAESAMAARAAGAPMARGLTSTATPRGETIALPMDRGRSVPARAALHTLPTPASTPPAARTSAAAHAAAAENECIICCSEPKSHVLVPCGHQTLCGPCADSVSSCPICRVDVTARVKVFFV
ncbi:hypothetical protein HK405_009646 [Cladochytrium tenue]|nr:hypothetical protein HK405_009646 [Cladochytrium tenue]